MCSSDLVTPYCIISGFRGEGRQKKTKPVYPIVSCRGRVCLPEDTKQTVFGQANLAPTNYESVKSELAKINKRQDDIIRFIRSYEEDKLNPMIRTSHSIATRFDTALKEQKGLITSEIEQSRELQDNVLKKISETFNQHAGVINNQAKQINELAQSINASSKKQERNNNKLLKLISLYSELATCGVMDGKRKENLRAEINDLINE